MTESIQRCSNCGAYHIKIYSWLDARQQLFFFCSPQCKREYLDKLSMEEPDAGEQESPLREVRSLVGRKGKKGRISIVRSERTVEGRTTEETD